MFTFPSTEKMHAQIAKADKALSKLNLGTITAKSVTPRKVRDGENSLGEPRFVVVYDAELELPAEIVKIKGQQVVARLESVEGLNVVTRLTDDASIDLKSFLDAKITCDHCGLTRNRKASWVVKSEDRGLIQVGDSCADLYFGIDVLATLKVIEKVYFLLVGEDMWEEDGGGRGSWDFDHFASIVLWQVMTSGFVTRKQAEETGATATCNYANFLIGPAPLSGSSLEAWKKGRADHDAWIYANPETAAKVSEKALDWWMEREDLPEFEHNCKVAVMSRREKFDGLAAFAIKLWAEAVFGKKAGANSQHVGKVGEKLVTKGTVVKLGSFETAYGTTTVVTFEDEAGNLLVWKASVDPKVTMGQTYAIKGTIKKHDAYKGQNQTILSRCTLKAA